MYLHLGQDVVIQTKNVVGIFDLEKASLSPKTKDFLARATKWDHVVTVSYEMPKTFIVTVEEGQTRVYISQISSSTLKKRAGLG